jgi:imidazolonepropionase-like amidohydrolase
LDEDLPSAAEEEARISGAWAKVIGDFVGPGGQMRLNYRPKTLAEAARRVHAVGARIAVHATTSEAIEAAIEAGFDSIEHGWGLQDDHLTAMAARGITLIPTMTLLPTAPTWLPRLGLAPAALEMMLAAARRHPEMVRRAVEAGVLVLAGTDAGMGPHGMIHEEIRHLRDAGVPSETALAAGSWAARHFLGLPGLEEGAPADIVAYPNDPRDDLTVLARPSLMILDGKLLCS